MVEIDDGSISQQHKEEESSYQQPDGGESSMNDGRNCVTKSVPTMQGTIFPVIKENIPILDTGQTSEIIMNMNAMKSTNIVGVDGDLCSSVSQTTSIDTNFQEGG
eukprot:4664934-Ditylum_brightwellii.AAC.1